MELKKGNDLLEGLNKGVRNIPVFFINGKCYTGKPCLDELSTAIEIAVKDTRRKKEVS